MYPRTVLWPERNTNQLQQASDTVLEHTFVSWIALKKVLPGNSRMRRAVDLLDRCSNANIMMKNISIGSNMEGRWIIAFGCFCTAWAERDDYSESNMVRLQGWLCRVRSWFNIIVNSKCIFKSCLPFMCLWIFLVLFGNSVTLKGFPAKKKGSMNTLPTLCIICPCRICAIKFCYICLLSPTKFYSGFQIKLNGKRAPELSFCFVLFCFPSTQ